MAALREKILGISLLKICAANFTARNLCGNSEDRNAVALTVVEAINQMHVAGATTSGTDRQLASEMGLGAGGESGRLLVSYANPADILSNPNRICNSVERVAGDSIDPFHASIGKNVDQQFGYCFVHHIHPSLRHALCIERVWFTQLFDCYRGPASAQPCRAAPHPHCPGPASPWLCGFRSLRCRYAAIEMYFSAKCIPGSVLARLQRSRVRQRRRTRS